jgi:hypothetical protein
MRGKLRGEKSTGGSGTGAAWNAGVTFWIGAIVAILTIATAVGKTIQYYETKLFQLKETSLVQEHNSREAALKNQYETRLRSLEFGVGDKKGYFDVSKVLIQPGQIYSLPPTSRQFNLGPQLTFFVADYPGEDWTFTESNELAVTEMMVGRDQALREARDMGLEDELRATPIYLFRPRDEFSIDMSGRLVDPNAARRLTFFPVIAIEPIEHGPLAGNLAAGRERVTKMLAKRNQQTNLTSRIDADVEVVSALNNIFRADFVGAALKSLLNEDFKYVSQYKNVEYRLFSVQKAGNVLFLQSTLTFNDSVISGREGRATLNVHELVFLVSAPDRSFFIRALIPGFPGQYTKQFDWVRRWLTGVRVVWA